MSDVDGLMFPRRVCVCGGSAIGHALAGIIGARGDVAVDVLTRRPNEWQRTIRVLYQDNLELHGHIDRISDDPSAIIPEADMVFLAVPPSVRRSLLVRIAAHLRPNSWVGALPGFGGFDWVARAVLGERIGVFGSQRIPFVCNSHTYGNSVKVMGVRPQTFMAALPATRICDVSAVVGELLHTRTVPMPNYLSISLFPTNPVMNPARLYALFADCTLSTLFDETPELYADWDARSTKVFGACDAEIQAICRALPVDLGYVAPIVQLYEVPWLSALTAKVRSLRTLHGRPAPLRQAAAGYVLDTGSPYFTEDVAFGLVMIRSIAEIAAVETPMMDEIIGWAEGLMGTEYMRDGLLRGRDTSGLPTTHNYGIRSVDQLIAAAT